MHAVKGEGLRNHGFAGCSAGAMVPAVLLLCLPALAGCGSAEEPRVQRVAFCQGHSGDRPDDGFLDVEFRQGSTVVATGSVGTGFALSAEVPWGATQIYVDGVRTGAVDEGVSSDAYHSPGPHDVTYIHSGAGCPDSASL